MKKIVSILLVLVTVLSMGTMAFADGTTTLTTTVPAATYTLNIPADQTIAFGATSTNIGELSVTNGKGFAAGKDLKVTISYDAFKCENTTTTIPFDVSLATASGGRMKVASGSSLIFGGLTSGGVEKYQTIMDGVTGSYATQFLVLVPSANWGKALGGDYTATITFTSEVVAGA